MADFVFTSPGAKFKERDLTYVTRNVGITTLGLAGETQKGPAFEPVFIQDQTQFAERFGAQSTKRFPNGLLKYQLPYVANAFLEEAQQLYVTRVLGFSGYQAGPSWNIVLQAGADESVAVSGATTPFTSGYTDYQFMGVAIGAQWGTGTYDSGWELVGANSFEKTIMEFTATTYNAGTGIVTGETVVWTTTELPGYDNMVLAVIRSKGISDTELDALTSVTDFETTELDITVNKTIDPTLNPNGDIFDSFTLLANNPITNTSSQFSGDTKSYQASLDKTNSNYLPNVIGYGPRDKATMIWVQAIYPDLIAKLDEDGIAYGIKTEMITGDTNVFTDYETSYKTPETPWVVSQLKGNTVDRLFKLISISDGNAGNEEIKISIVNIDPYAGEFDVIVRAFYDTDAAPTVLETYTKCTMVKNGSSYIARKIGDDSGEYTLRSKYIMVALHPEAPEDVYPAGFEGFMLNDYAVSGTSDPSGPFSVAGIAPAIFYKTGYTNTDKVNKTFLGVSELAYTGKGINQDMFDYNNWNGDYVSKSKGFHMDISATTAYADGVLNYFEVGAGVFNASAVDSPTNPYYDIKKRKFTLVPAGGFDGWDVNRLERSYGDEYSENGRRSGEKPLENDFQAWEFAIDTFANPENVTINLFATPGINWAEQTILVQNTIDMIEQQRTDTLYVIDSIEEPASAFIEDEGKADVITARGIASMMDETGIDSNYSCTYFPWILMRDTQNNVNVYIPPTGEVVKAMAFTDNTKFPWFAPAGLNRGVTNAIKSQVKLSLEARDVLYEGRINPMADFADAGTAIFGQKTLQVRESALDRINVRRLLLQIKVLIANISVRLLFEQNDQQTIDQFLSKTNPILDSIKRERGLTDFRIKMDSSNNTPETRDRNELFGEIFLKPTRSLEFIGITFTITPSGASFADVGA